MSKKTFSVNLLLLASTCAAFLLLFMCYTHDHQFDFSAATSVIHQFHYQDSDPKFKPKQWKIIYYQKPRKTGGTAMVELLRQNGLDNTTRRLCYSSSQPEKFIKVKNRCIGSNHNLFINEYWPFYTMTYLKYKHEQFNDVLMITLLRDPIKRVFSDLLYQGTWKCSNINYKRLLSVTEADLIQCVEHHHAKFTSNLYSKMFSGVWPYAMMNKNLMKKNIDFNANMTMDDVQFGISKLIINEFDVILILEQWALTSVQLKCYGIKDTTLPHSNVGKLKKRFDQFRLENFPALKDKIIEYNAYDIAFYEFAKLLSIDRSTACDRFLSS